MLELALQKAVRVERTPRFLNAGFADERKIAEDADLLRMAQGPLVQFLDGEDTRTARVSNGRALAANPPRSEICGNPRRGLFAGECARTRGHRTDLPLIV